MQAIGGHYSGRWFDVPKNSHQWVVPVPRLGVVDWSKGVELDPMAEVEIRTDTYTVERLVWPGFRFPIWVLVAPGVNLHEKWTEYDSSWPNPLIPVPLCRCEELDRTGAPWEPVPLSACHLDHCPIHGRWTFPPITPMQVSIAARAQWLAEQDFERQDVGARAIESGADPATLWNRT